MVRIGWTNVRIKFKQNVWNDLILDHEIPLMLTQALFVFFLLPFFKSTCRTIEMWASWRFICIFSSVNISATSHWFGFLVQYIFIGYPMFGSLGNMWTCLCVFTVIRQYIRNDLCFVLSICTFFVCYELANPSIQRSACDLNWNWNWNGVCALDRHVCYMVSSIFVISSASSVVHCSCSIKGKTKPPQTKQRPKVHTCLRDGWVFQTMDFGALLNGSIFGQINTHWLNDAMSKDFQKAITDGWRKNEDKSIHITHSIQHTHTHISIVIIKVINII